MALVSGVKLGVYEIGTPLGAGGMGEVYRARDTRLGRDVALKVLPNETASDLDRLKRFQREARTVAALNHPHIVTIHSVEEVNGTHFLTMELVEGSVLARLIPSAGMPLDKFLELAIPLADAVAAAHEKGIVHRDIKPGNVMVDKRGMVKVLDFGLAKISDPCEDVQSSKMDTMSQTQPGFVMGTVPYMSPEQLQGQHVDQRSDIFSLGGVLYEMVAGAPPFVGKGSAELMSAILRDQPTPVTELRSDVPSGLQRILDRCLAKEAAHRYSSTGELREALERLKLELSSGARAAASGAQEPSVAVLPFTNVSADPENEFFADGITEEIMNALAQIEGLHVAARTSSFTFKGKHVDLRVVGERLNVRTVLEGSVRKAGNRLRITAQLVNVNDGYHLWSERYDRELKDIFEVQDEIAQSIAEKLRLTLKRDHQPSQNAGTENLEAYELYLKGRALLYRRGLDIRRAVQSFERAVTLDPEYALSWAGLADANNMLGLYGFEPPAKIRPVAKGAARRAVAINSFLAETQSAMGCVSLLCDWDLAKAEQGFLRARELNPRYMQNLAWYALFYLIWARGRFDEGIAVMTEAVKFDPLSAYANAMLAFSFGHAGRGSESVEAANGAIRLEESFFTYWALQHALHAGGRLEEAAAAGDMAMAVSGRHPFAISAQATIFSDWGKEAQAKALYTELMARSAAGYIQPTDLAITASAAGETEMALKLAQTAFETHDPMLITAKYWPHFARLRKEPGFTAILLKMGLK
jgi:serine/threonine protein kinase